MIKKLGVYVLLSILISLGACKDDAKMRCINKRTAATLRDYTGFDGCRWVILLSDDTVLEPINLSDFNNFNLEDSKNVCITFDYVDAASICMIGPSIKLLSISNL